MWISLRSLRGGSCDPPPLPGSKKHQKLFSPEKSFFMVFKHGEHEYECRSASDHFREGHVTPLHFRGQRNIENYFSLKIRFQCFSGMGNTDMSVDQSQITSRGVMWPPSTSGVKETSKIIFAWKTFSGCFQAWGTRIWVWISHRPLRGGSHDLLPLPGSKNNENYFCLKNLFWRFSGCWNLHTSVSWP